jgi:hypothetical protein
VAIDQRRTRQHVRDALLKILTLSLRLRRRRAAQHRREQEHGAGQNEFVSH